MSNGTAGEGLNRGDAGLAGLTAFSVLMLNDLLGRTSGDEGFLTAATSAFALALPMLVMMTFVAIGAKGREPDWGMWIIVVAVFAVALGTGFAIGATHPVASFVFMAALAVAFILGIEMIREIGGWPSPFSRRKGDSVQPARRNREPPD